METDDDDNNDDNDNDNNNRYGTINLLFTKKGCLLSSRISLFNWSLVTRRNKIGTTDAALRA